MRTRILVCVALVMAFASSGACARHASRRQPTNDLLIIGYDREPDTLNRFSTHILEDVQTCIIEGLTVTDEQMNVIPVLATEVPTLENGGVRLTAKGGMDVTWRLRPGVKWHDGRPFTSDDVKFTVEAINDPAYNPESTDGFDRISSVDTPDPLTAIIHYREVYAPYAIQFIRGCLPRHVLAGRDIDRANDYNRNPLGTGPYKLKEWKTGEYILLERAPGYWRGSDQPRIRSLMFKFLPNTNTRITELQTGEVDLVGLLPWDKYREVSSIPGITVHRMIGNGYENISLNQRHFPPLADIRVRQALIHALDRELLVRTILDGLAPVVDGPIQSVSWAFNNQIRHYNYDPARARALLDDAGWRTGSGGIRSKAGTPLAFTLITQAGFAIRENMAQAIQRQWRDVGVDARIQLFDGTTISAVWFEGRFDAMLHWWHLPSDPELTLFFAKDRMPPAGRNINYISDDKLTALLYASDRTVNLADRRRLLFEAQAQIADLAPEIPLYNVTRLDAIPSSLQGFKGNPTNTGMFWNIYDWQLQK
jgi:peptide/nickel transport system substrate-binding protein